MNGQLSFRTMLNSDLDRVYQIESKAHSHPWSKKVMTQSLENAHRFGVVAELEGSDNKHEMVGFYFLSNVVGEAEVLDIVVNPEFQGRGYGKDILLELIRHSQALSAHSLFLEVRESNLPAIGLYESIGFNQIGKRDNYYPCNEHGREDALLYAFELVD